MNQNQNLNRLELIRTSGQEVNGEPIEDHFQQILVYKDEKGELKKGVRVVDIYYYPKDKSKDEDGIPDLNWISRNRDYDCKKSLKEKLSLFWDLIEEMRKKQ